MYFLRKILILEICSQEDDNDNPEEFLLERRVHARTSRRRGRTRGCHGRRAERGECSLGQEERGSQTKKR